MMLHSILLLASFALGVPELPQSAYVDTEVSTNFPIAVEDDGKHWMTFVVSLVESQSNNVEVAVGTDTDGNGVLGVDDEVAVLVAKPFPAGRRVVAFLPDMDNSSTHASILNRINGSMKGKILASAGKTG